MGGRAVRTSCHSTRRGAIERPDVNLHLAQSAYCGNLDEVVEGVIDSYPIAAAVPSMTAVRTMWTGTASNLLGALAEVVGDGAAKSKTGRMALGRWRAGCDGRQPSCARSA
jgi:hypothetical protein